MFFPVVLAYVTKVKNIEKLANVQEYRVKFEVYLKVIQRKHTRESSAHGMIISNAKLSIPNMATSGKAVIKYEDSAQL